VPLTENNQTERIARFSFFVFGHFFFENPRRSLESNVKLSCLFVDKDSLVQRFRDYEHIQCRFVRGPNIASASFDTKPVLNAVRQTVCTGTCLDFCMCVISQIKSPLGVFLYSFFFIE